MNWFLDIDPAYPTVLPQDMALALVFAANLAIPCFALFASRHMKSATWLPHTLAFLWVLFSVFTFLILATPSMRDDETGGPGEGFGAIPILVEEIVILLLYLGISTMLVAKWCLKKAGTARLPTH